MACRRSEIEDASVLSRPGDARATVPVELRIGPRAEVDIADALRRIREVLNSDNEFCEYLNSRTPVTEVLAQFEGARTTADLIAVANRLE